MASPRVLLADISEFQPSLGNAAYAAWSQAIIIRALYGTSHVDRAWYGGARRDLLHACGMRFTGIYQYIVAGQDPVRQADALADLLRGIRPGEKIIGDIEEGAGNQARRRDLWRARIQHRLGDTPWIYSGLYFARDHGLSPVEWVAAYQPDEPRTRHILWQFTDKYPVPGVGPADCSLFHGTIDQLAALAWHPAGSPPPVKPPAPKPPVLEEDDVAQGLITVAPGTRQSVTSRAGTVKQIVLYSDWEGTQPAAPVVALRVGHVTSATFDAGKKTVAGTYTYIITSPADCNGCSLTRVDPGAATVAYSTNPV